MNKEALVTVARLTIQTKAFSRKTTCFTLRAITTQTNLKDLALKLGISTVYTRATPSHQRANNTRNLKQKRTNIKIVNLSKRKIH